MTDEIETTAKKVVVETRTFTRTLPRLQLDMMPKKSTALDPMLYISQRIVNGKPEAPVTRLRVRRVRRDGVEARNSQTSFELRTWLGGYHLQQNFTRETIERIEQAAREALSEFEAVDWATA